MHNVKRVGIGLFVLFCIPLFLGLVSTVFAVSENSNAPVCPGPANKDSVRCHARVVTDPHGKPQVTALPSGFGPNQFRGAYNLPSTATSNTLLAIVDAYDQPNIKSDLDKYSTTYGLPLLPNCTVPIGVSSIPCFQKVDQRGGTKYPSVNAGWALEISLDVEIAHAICPNCRLLLVEADSSSFTNLMTAVDKARTLGAKVISNSYGAGEFNGQSTFNSYFNYPGVVFTFSTGDSGYGVQYPASSPFVTAVGGTSLTVDGSNHYVSETAWAGAGSGCSAYETKPSFQTDLGCAKRTVADVSADANPNTGAAIYDSVRYQGQKGWFQVGGTSLASPIIAGTFALVGGVTAGTQGNSVPYTTSAPLHDIVTGSNGTCGGSYLCTAAIGYDGPTGLGSPNGTGAF